MTIRRYANVIFVTIALLLSFPVFAQESRSPSDSAAEDTLVGEMLASAPANPTPPVQPPAVVPPVANNAPVVGLADLHLHQWAHFMNAGQWMFGESSGVAHEELTECGWHTGNSRGFEGRVTPRQRHGQGIGRRRAGRSVTRFLFGAERADDIVEQHPPAGISRDQSMPHWMGWPTSDSIAHQQVWHGWLRLAHDGIPFLHFMHRRSLTDVVDSLREFYEPANYLGHVRAAHAEGVAGLNLVVVSLVHSVAGCRQFTPKAALRRDPTLCSDMDAITDQYHAAMEWAADNASWVQVVRTPSEARTAIHEGKLAIVLSIEASDIFGPSRTQQSFFAEVDALVESHSDPQNPPSRTAVRDAIAAGIRRWLRELEYVSTFQIAHQLDNAFSSAGYIKRTLTSFSQGRVGRILECRWRPPGRIEERGTRPGEDCSSGQDDCWRRAYEYAACLDEAVDHTRGLMSSIGRRPWRRPWRDRDRDDGIPANPYGLSYMGQILVDVMISEGMPIDAVHMSDIAQSELIDYLDSEGYPDYPVYVSHTYPSESNALRREQNLDASLQAGLARHGGLVGVRPGDDEHIVIPGSGEIEAEGSHASCQGTSIGTRMHLAALGALPVTFGTDLNGFINQTRPSGMIRPERTLSGGTGQDCGSFIEDVGSEIRSRGLAHVGLLPASFLEMLFSASGAEQQRIASMANGAEAYIQLWERATPRQSTPAPYRDVNIQLLHEMLFESQGGPLNSFVVSAEFPGVTMLQTVETVESDGNSQRAPLMGQSPLTVSIPVALPRLRVIESTLPYGPVVTRIKDQQATIWYSYPQLPTSIGLLIGTQSFGRHPVGAQLPVKFCRQNRDDDRDSASWRACEQLRQTRALYRRPWWRTSMSPRGRFSGWRREFPNQNRWGDSIALHLDVGENWTLPAELPYSQEVYDWLEQQAASYRQRILRNRFFENAPVPGYSFLQAHLYAQQVRDSVIGLPDYLVEDRIARRCLNRSGRGSQACQAFVGIRAYCQLSEALLGHSLKDYCEPFIRDVSR